MGVLDAELVDYLEFHTQVVQCRVCQASLADLRERRAAEEESVQTRRSRYFQSSAGMLSRRGED